LDVDGVPLIVGSPVDSGLELQSGSEFHAREGSSSLRIEVFSLHQETQNFRSSSRLNISAMAQARFAQRSQRVPCTDLS
jgi:hypothetical protein